MNSEKRVASEFQVNPVLNFEMFSYNLDFTLMKNEQVLFF